MNSFLRGFISIFDWFGCDRRSPSERVEEILDEFYSDHPWIERDDRKALENDWKKVLGDYGFVPLDVPSGVRRFRRRDPARPAR